MLNQTPDPNMNFGAKSIGKYTFDGFQIGSSASTQTELATHQVTRSKVVIKLSDANIPNGRQSVERLHHVARILSQVRHPNVIRLYEVMQVNGRYYAIVLELCAGGTLEQYVREHSEYFTEQTTRSWLFQLLSAFHYLHERGIVHRYMQPSNVLLDDRQRHLKLSDFSYACNSNHETLKASVPLETHLYNNAPELHQSEAAYHPSTIDIWTLGTVTLFMLSGGCLPSTQMHLEEMVSLQINDEFWKQISPECQDMLGRILEHRWVRRASLLEIETHEWMTMEKGRTFSPSGPTPRNHALRNLVFKRLSKILKLDSKQLRAKVHEYRVDEFSAMANLMTDDFLAMKEECDMRNKKPSKFLNQNLKQNSTTYNSWNITCDYGGRRQFQEDTVLKGTKMKLTDSWAHIRCKAQHGNTYKMQYIDEESMTKEQVNAILDEILSCYPLPQSERSSATKGRRRTRPLGNATSYNMAVARNLYDRQRATTRPATTRPSTRSAVLSRTKKPKILMKEKERSKSAPGIGRTDSCRSLNVQRHRNSRNVSAHVDVDRSMGDVQRLPESPSNMTNHVIRIISADGSEVCKNRHRARNCDKVLSNHDFGVTGGTINIKNRPNSGRSCATDKECLQEPKEFTTVYSGASISRPSSVCIRSVTKVLLSPSVVSLDACGLPNEWKMIPGATSPKKRFVGGATPPSDKKDRGRRSRVKNSLDVKYATPRAKSESSVVIYPNAQQPGSRALGKAAVGHSVSTCTACDLQEVATMSMLSSAVVRIRCDYSANEFTSSMVPAISTNRA